MEGINKTLVVKYADACTIMDYKDDYCGCCKLRVYKEWYDENKAYFVKKGVCLIDDLLLDEEGNDLRYCFVFDFEDPLESKFSVVNYYNQEKIADFRYVRAENDVYDPKITVDYINNEAFSKFGTFCNPITLDKIQRLKRAYMKPYESLPNDKYSKYLKIWREKQAKILSDFMWEHSVEFIHSAMFYFTLQKPDKIVFEDNIMSQPETKDAVFNKKTVKYYYSGYVDLSKTKIYKVVTSSKLEDKKKKDRKKFERHIEKWSVRGHYRNINGKKVWVNPHEKGEGILENRIYGVAPLSELNLEKKVFTREVEVLEVPKAHSERHNLEETAQPIVQSEQKVLSFWEKLIKFIKNIFR